MNDNQKYNAAWYQSYDFRRNPDRLSGAARRFLWQYAYSAGWSAEKPAYTRIARGKFNNPTALRICLLRELKP